MKLCFLVMGHHQPRVFHRLLDVLCAAGADVAVHIDARARLADFLRQSSTVQFMPDRRKVHWAGWSQTRAIIGLMRFGLEVSDADYFLFLAGTDFPIKHPGRLAEHLQRSGPRSFLNHYPVVPGIWGYGLCSRFHLVDARAAVFDRKFRAPEEPGKIRAGLIAGIDRLEDALNARFAPRRIDHLKLYHGSTRWCLHRRLVAAAVNAFHSSRNRPLRRHLRFCTSSDELFIQTVILNSELASECSEFDTVESEEIFSGAREPLQDEKRVYFHYIDWSPEREDPAILDERDFPALQASDKFFAVKFLDDRSLALIDRIEKELL